MHVPLIMLSPVQSPNPAEPFPPASVADGKMAIAMDFPRCNLTTLEGDFSFSFLKKWNFSPALECELDL